MEVQGCPILRESFLSFLCVIHATSNSHPLGHFQAMNYGFGRLRIRIHTYPHKNLDKLHRNTMAAAMSQGSWLHAEVEERALRDTSDKIGQVEGVGSGAIISSEGRERRKVDVLMFFQDCL